MDIMVEDGTGLVTANSYLSVDKADEMLSINIHSQWSIVPEDAKEKLLMWASRIIDMRVDWYGHKTYSSSGLAWPRTGMRNREGQCIDDNVVPKEVELATALLADLLVSGDPTTVNSSANLTSLQVDVIVLKFDSRQDVEKYPSELSLILAGLGFLKFGGRGAKRIIKH